MLEPPSPALLARLYDWQLCQPADVRRARRFVRRLAADLPAFDSVWIDALVQLGKLTPYQAEMLESDSPSDLRVGPYLLQAQLGRSAWSCSWRARAIGSRQLSVVKRVAAPTAHLPDIATRGRALLAACVRGSCSHVLAPDNLWEEQGACYFVSPYVHGVPLAELLVRRGRFPASIVGEVARQLVTGLAEWHRLGLVHGDLRPAHIRIDSSGQLILVEAGLRLVIEPEMSLHAAMSLEAYDGIAPELLTVGQEPTVASDFYALGCVLWQLLAGRPPFSVADPLAKLAAHQTRTIDDVRDWAPETPAWLAELIQQLTQRDAGQRPRSARAILETIARERLPGSRGIRQFRDQFELAVPHLRPQATRRSWLPIGGAVAGASLIAAGLWLSDGERRAELLSLTSWSTRAASDTSPARSTAATLPVNSQAGLLPFPVPSATGIVQLSSAGPYAVGTIRYAGHLQIRAAPGVTPEILVRDQPLRLASGRLTLAGLRIRRDTTWTGATPLKALVLAHAQQIEAEGCGWDLGGANPRRPEPSPPVSLAWRLVEPLDPEAGQIRLAGCVFQGQGSGIFANQALRQLEADNVLFRLSGRCLDLQVGEHSQSLRLELHQTTAREVGTLLTTRTDGLAVEPLRLRLMTTHCVLAPHTGGSLVQWESAQPPVLTTENFRWEGAATLIPSDATLMSWTSELQQPAEPWETDQFLIDGLLAGNFQFQGLPTQTLADSVLGETEIPRSSETLPGIQLAKFPRALGGDLDLTADGLKLSLEAGDQPPAETRAQ